MSESFTTWNFLLEEPKVVAEIFPRIGEARFATPSLRIVADEEGISFILIPDQGVSGRTEAITWVSAARILLRSESFSFGEMKLETAQHALRQLGVSDG